MRMEVGKPVIKKDLISGEAEARTDTRPGAAPRSAEPWAVPSLSQQMKGLFRGIMLTPPLCGGFEMGE